MEEPTEEERLLLYKKRGRLGVISRSPVDRGAAVVLAPTATTTPSPASPSISSTISVTAVLALVTPGSILSPV